MGSGEERRYVLVDVDRDVEDRQVHRVGQAVTGPLGDIDERVHRVPGRVAPRHRNRDRIDVDGDDPGAEERSADGQHSGTAADVENAEPGFGLVLEQLEGQPGSDVGTTAERVARVDLDRPSAGRRVEPRRVDRKPAGDLDAQ